MAPEFQQRLRAMFKPEHWEMWQAAQAVSPPTVFRVNPLRGEVSSTLDELQAAGLAPEALPGMAGVYRVAPARRRALTDSAAFAQGRIYVQNPASMLAPLALAPQAGEEVLDLCAAPGSKTTQMAAMMGNTGRIGAVERSRARHFKLRAVCALQGADNVRTYLMDGRAVGRKTPERFDRVLVDAPCSSEARVRLDQPETLAYWSEKKIRDMAKLQKRLLWAGFQALKPGGALVYSTCTYAPEENEAVVQDLIRRAGAAVALEAPELPVDNWTPGLPGWWGKAFDARLSAVRRVLPTADMEGFFIARLRKLAAPTGRG